MPFINGVNMKKERYQVSDSYLKECYDRIIVARTKMMLGCPFFGVLATQLELVPNNTWCRTLAVDGKHLFFNVEFIMGLENPKLRQEYEEKLKDSIDDITEEQINDALNGLTQDNLIAAINHEILHCAYNHFLRMGTRDKNKWNKAADYAINQIIKRDSGRMGTIKSSWLYNKDFEGKTAEEIYNILTDLGDNNSSYSGGTLDHHDISSEMDDDSDESYPYSTEQMEGFMDKFKTSMMGASLTNNIPPEIRAMIESVKESKIDWRTKLNRTIRSLIKNDVSYSIPNRRTWSNGIGYGMPIYPGLKPDLEIDICIAIDASGSISKEMINDFISEVYGITQYFSEFNIKILTFDTGIYEVCDYTTGEEEKILSYQVYGGGGTNFDVVWEYMKKEQYCPKQLIMFTDGEPFGSWGDSEYCDTLFVIHSNKKKIAPFGETTHY